MSSTYTTINGQIVHEQTGETSRFFLVDPGGEIAATIDPKGRIIDRCANWLSGGGYNVWTKAPEPKWAWSELETSRMEFNADHKLTFAIYQASASIFGMSQESPNYSENN